MDTILIKIMQFVIITIAVIGVPVMTSQFEKLNWNGQTEYGDLL
jgi:hypothetical protein